MIAILGTGTLAQSLASKLTAKIFNRSACDFLEPLSDRFIDELKEYNTIINCIGVNTGTAKEILQTNYLTPLSLIESLNKREYKGRVIMIGSHGASWTSWPGISYERLIYNQSKENLRNFVKGFMHSGLSTMQLTIVEPTKFKSPMNNYQGVDVDSTVESIVKILQISDLNLLHVEIGS